LFAANFHKEKETNVKRSSTTMHSAKTMRHNRYYKQTYC